MQRQRLPIVHRIVKFKGEDYLVDFDNGKFKGYGSLSDSPIYKVREVGNLARLHSLKRSTDEQALYGKELSLFVGDGGGKPFVSGPAKHKSVHAPDRVYALCQAVDDDALRWDVLISANWNGNNIQVVV